MRDRSKWRMAKAILGTLGLLALAACAAALPGVISKRPGRPPNILFVLADDLGIDSTRLYPLYDPKGENVSLPTLEALAAKGIVFDNARATPLCSPTRGMILSGRYPNANGVNYVGVPFPATTISLHGYMARHSTNNYATAAIGKWHLGKDLFGAIGVPHYDGMIGSGVSDYFNWTETRYKNGVTSEVKVTEYATTHLVNRSIEFIDGVRAEKSDRPWFLYLAFNAPHGTAPNDGFQVPPKNLWNQKELASIADRPVDGKIYNGDIPVYQALTQSMDTELGRLLAHLDAIGERENTLIIFMGDNGTPAAVQRKNIGPLRGTKWDIQDGGVRVPLMVVGAGVTRHGVREDALVVATDMFATVAQIAGARTAGMTDTFSIAPYFTNARADNGRSFVFTGLCPPANAPIRDMYTIVSRDNHKLSYDKGGWQFYDLKADPAEGHNIYAAEKPSATQMALKAEIDALATRPDNVHGCFHQGSPITQAD
ncbi:MAG: sulfatase-like hydrolase/transferase [Pseudomonadota bacterium]